MEGEFRVGDILICDPEIPRILLGGCNLRHNTEYRVVMVIPDLQEEDGDLLEIMEEGCETPLDIPYLAKLFIKKVVH
ncbi:MAG: hypothetical protein HY457_00750 [Parcubacteria group bacterium]|nr:hypothetical protein [Parcubacteria group bacterium]